MRDTLIWPGDADTVRSTLEALQTQWRDRLGQLTDADLRSPSNTRWPLRDLPFADVVAWASVELTKNAAEIGYVRFLYAVSTQQ